MIKKILKYSVSVAIAALFLWLAFRNVKFEELTTYFTTMSYSWLIPFSIVTLIAHYLRAERWLLLLEEQEDIRSHRLSLFTGVMLGYLVNYAFPRLGEVSRCVYVGKKKNIPSSTLLGTVVLERIIDLICMAILLLIVAVYVIADVEILGQIFGDRMVGYIQGLMKPANLIYGVLALAGLGVVGYGVLRLIELLSRSFELVAKGYEKFQQLNRMFLDGLLSLRKVKNWWAFLAYTVLIWFGYILLVYFPFWMFDLQDTYNLNLLDATSITVISAIGIVLPSPGGIGTYHYFVKQALLILAAVPAVTGLAFGLVTHAVMMILVVIATSLLLLLDRSGKETVKQVATPADN